MTGAGPANFVLSAHHAEAIACFEGPRASSCIGNGMCHCGD